jgi:hypothetical protein
MALSADAPLRFPTEPRTQKWVVDNSSAATVYKGAPMIMDLSADTVYPSMFVTATVVDAADIFIGIAAEGKVIATTDTETDNVIEIYVWPSIIGFKSTVYTDADVGDTVYMSDNDTLSATAADNPQIGKLERVEDGYAYVQLVTPQVCTGA